MRHACHTPQRVMLDLALGWVGLVARSLATKLTYQAITLVSVGLAMGVRALGHIVVLTKVEATWWRWVA